MRIFNDVKQCMLHFLDLQHANNFRQELPGKSIPKYKQHENSHLRS